MPRTREQLDQAATDADAWLDSLDPATTPAEDISDLRPIADALTAIAVAEGALAEAVERARENGHSWGRIAMVLGTSKQSAHQRFGLPALMRHAVKSVDRKADVPL